MKKPFGISITWSRVEAALFVPSALAAVALKYTDGCFSLRVVDHPHQSQLVIAKTALYERVSIAAPEITKLHRPEYFHYRPTPES
jgi:hypothetical protein